MSDTDSKISSDELSYRSRTTPLHVWHDALDAGSLSTTVVTAVAKAADTDPTSLPPLYEAIDPDALDKLLGGGLGSSGSQDGYLTFTYADHSITVHADGEIVVHAIERE